MLFTSNGYLMVFECAMHVLHFCMLLEYSIQIDKCLKMLMLVIFSQLYVLWITTSLHIIVAIIFILLPVGILVLFAESAKTYETKNLVGICGIIILPKFLIAMMELVCE